MVKRAKLTLDYEAAAPEAVAEVDVAEDRAGENEARRPMAEILQQSQAKGLWKMGLIAGLTLVSLVVFRSKVF